ACDIRCVVRRQEEDAGRNFFGPSRTLEHCAASRILIVLGDRPASLLKTARVEWREYRTRANGVRADTFGSMIHCQATRQAGYGMFCSVVLDVVASCDD